MSARLPSLLLLCLAACALPLRANQAADALPAHTAFAPPAAAVPTHDAIKLPMPGLSYARHAGMEVLVIRSVASTAMVTRHGGQLVSFVPHGQQDLLWLSPTTTLPPQPIRGGVPVLWPYFSRQGQATQMPAHGLVRTLAWSVLQAQRHADGSMSVTLAPPPLPELPLSLRMTLRVGRSLEQTLVTTNTSAQVVRFTQALHSYYRVGDVRQVQVEGLGGASYRNKHDDYVTAWVQAGRWSLGEAGARSGIDRIYGGVGGDYVLIDPVLRRKIRVRTGGSDSVVLWNPGEQAQTRMADVGAGWRHYLCLETANAGQDVVELAPGAQTRLSQRIQALALD